MPTYPYPNGSSLESTALTDIQVETAFQYATAQMLGIVTDPFNVSFALTLGSAVAVPASFNLIYAGESVVGAGIPAGTTILSVNPGVSVTLSNPATATGLSSLTVSDPNVWSDVRIGWMKQGQPFGDINSDIVYIRSEPMDSEYSRLRDNQLSGNTAVLTMTDVFTRSWKTFWTFYGPNALNNAKAVQSALIKVQFIADLLAVSNLYINPSIEEPARVPENFQGEWWERVDLMVELNEQVTETLTVGSVKSVEVQINTETGVYSDFTVTAPN